MTGRGGDAAPHHVEPGTAEFVERSSLGGCQQVGGGGEGPGLDMGTGGRQGALLPPCGVERQRDGAF